MPDSSSIAANLLPGIDPVAVAGSFLQKSEHGEYTAEIIKNRKPEVYAAVVELLGREMGVHEVAQILQINPRSVMSIRDANPEKITLIKQSVSRKFLDVAQLSAEVARNRLLDDPDSISFKDLMIGGAVATDKHLVLTGEATQRIEHVVRSGDDDFGRMLEDARRRGQVIDAEVVDMDIGPRDGGTKGALPAGSGGAGGSDLPGPDVLDVTPVTCSPDMQSGVCGDKCHINEGESVVDTGGVADVGADPGAVDGAGACGAA